MSHYATSIHDDTSGDHEYHQLREKIANAVNEIKGPVFHTDAQNLWELFLHELPAERRQHYTCNACRRFIERYGDLATIDELGRVEPLIWNVPIDGIMWAPSVALAGRVARANITGVFLSSETVLGTPTSPGTDWTHFFCKTPELAKHKVRSMTAFQKRAYLTEDYKTLTTGLAEYSHDAVKVALKLLQGGDDLYRSEKVLGVAEWLDQLYSARKRVRSQKAKDNIVWRAVATAPAGFAHIRSTMISTLLDDIVAGKSFEQVSKAFAAKMHPLQYQRAQVPPKAGNVAAANKLIEKLGEEGALARRYAKLEDLELLWVPADARIKLKTPEGPFSAVETKAKSKKKAVGEDLLAERPAKEMRFEDFARDVMPRALRMQVQVAAHGNPIYAMVTAVDPEAPVITQWGNPVTWYTESGWSPNPATSWNLKAGWCDVTGICLYPFQWGDRGDKFKRHTPGAMFVVKNCRHIRNGMGMFSEMLLSDYYEIRSTIEAYFSQKIIEGREDATACGMVARQNAGTVTVRVWTKDDQRDFTVRY